MKPDTLPRRILKPLIFRGVPEWVIYLRQVLGLMPVTILDSVISTMLVQMFCITMYFNWVYFIC